MKKMPTLFIREFSLGKINITREVTPGCEWVLNGEGRATRKLDGTCAMVMNGELWKRYDAKHGKPVPVGAIPCQAEPDPVTGHFPCWVRVKPNEAADKWFTAAKMPVLDGTYELCGPHINGNHEGFIEEIFIRHGDIVLDDVPRDFDGIREYLEDNEMEGIVFHRGDGAMCKIKRSDFGIPWG